MPVMLLAAAAPQAAPAPRTAIDAERAFAADAQTLGQWTAFRKWAATDATMFEPQPVDAQLTLKTRRDPAKPIAWSPTAGFTSCDGRVAANTGEWRGPGGTVGFFTTIWVRQADGSWRWVVDGGDTLTAARQRVERPPVQRAACHARPAPPAAIQYREGRSDQRVSPDGTFAWRWHVSGSGARTFEALLWTGRAWTTVIADRIAAPPASKS